MIITTFPLPLPYRSMHSPLSTILRFLLRQGRGQRTNAKIEVSRNRNPRCFLVWQNTFALSHLERQL